MYDGEMTAQTSGAIEIGDPGISFDLDEKKKVQVREFQGKIYVDIREYY